MEHRYIRINDNPAVLNYLLNHSAIKPHIISDNAPEYLDASEVLASPDTYFFTFDGGGILFFDKQDRSYKSDIYVLPGKRGRYAKQAYQSSLGYMFGPAGASKIIAEASIFNRASRQFIGSLGFRRMAILPKAHTKDGVLYDVIQYELEKTWVV